MSVTVPISCAGKMIVEFFSVAISVIGMRALFLKFDIVRGLFLFSMFSGAIGSIVVAGFETFGFIPQFIFPVWDTGLMAVVWYLTRKTEE